ncbi:hypothetical protein HY061_00775 [Candidatus Azambacteria bacterium]|nr:hypothetical protein [Candidatus Azambacteria bacterium]
MIILIVTRKEVIVMKRALVLGPGGLAGAFSGGVVATLGRVLGYNYFSAVYGCSAGAYTGIGFRLKIYCPLR